MNGVRRESFAGRAFARQYDGHGMDARRRPSSALLRSIERRRDVQALGVREREALAKSLPQAPGRHIYQPAIAGHESDSAGRGERSAAALEEAVEHVRDSEIRNMSHIQPAQRIRDLGRTEVRGIPGDDVPLCVGRAIGQEVPVMDHSLGGRRGTVYRVAMSA
ncbi:hypothetical protein WT27_12625 [Burkholderia territorii]|uniref:Uncharacterized protein n=1 Tax=Burkholderia territorii TaxID=1503055 RepID=A0A105V401_9BURK|nr:hypothetical protein WT27_12625 [Burkholderia territorii]KVX33718.1 hypothetical protein WT31_08530 [Burkholderia territorii]